jgi:membrane protease YdiL (CAAX protease family)
LSLLLAVPGAWLARDIGLGLPAKACGPTAMLSLLLLAPMLEEYLLRSGLHAWLLQRWPQRLGGLSLANALCAAVFAIGHALRARAVAGLALGKKRPAPALARVEPCLVQCGPAGVELPGMSR